MSKHFFIRAWFSEESDDTMNYDLFVRADSYEQAAEIWFEHYEFEDDVTIDGLDDNGDPQEWAAAVCIIPEMNEVGPYLWHDINSTARRMVVDAEGKATFKPGIG